MLRILADIGDGEVLTLDALSKDRGQSRASLLREAVADYLAKHRRVDSGEAFGAWGKDGADGLAYQESLRAEW